MYTYYVCMANLTLSIEDELLQKGREYAAHRGTSLNSLVREYIRDLAYPTEEEVTGIIDRLRKTEGNSQGIKIDRESLYER